MRRVDSRALGVEERGDGVGVSSTTLQRVGGHHSVRLGILDGGLVGGSIQLLEGGMNACGTDWDVDRW